MTRISVGQLLAILVAMLGNFIADRFQPELRDRFQSSPILQYLVILTVIFSNQMDTKSTLFEAVVESSITFAVFVAVSQIHAKAFVLLLCLCILYVFLKGLEKEFGWNVGQEIVYWIIIAVCCIGVSLRAIETYDPRLSTPRPKESSLTSS